MQGLRVKDVLHDKILVSRESARRLQDALALLISRDNGHNESSSIAVDFDGVQGVAPSFVDELMIVIERLIAAEANIAGRSLVIVHPPNRLSSKFEAIARGHGMQVHENGDGAWVFSLAPQ